MDDSMCRQILEETSDAVVVSDREGMILFWNRGAENLFGHPQEHALGRSLDLIIPEKHRHRHWEGYRRVMATGETAYRDRTLKVPSEDRDGKTLSLEFSIVLLKKPGQDLEGAAAIIRDVTRQWERMKFLTKQVADLEKIVEKESMDPEPERLVPTPNKE
ncbi:MAG: PAS domain-containing protein [Proteobacteria bacterium]|nr:PAS domain-containing protein [Pseudomonadota bacterium]